MGMGELESRMREEAVERERNCSEREIGEEAEWKTIQGAACGNPMERVSAAGECSCCWRARMR